MLTLPLNIHITAVRQSLGDSEHHTMTAQAILELIATALIATVAATHIIPSLI